VRTFVFEAPGMRQGGGREQPSTRAVTT